MMTGDAAKAATIPPGRGANDTSPITDSEGDSDTRTEDCCDETGGGGFASTSEGVEVNNDFGSWDEGALCACVGKASPLSHLVSSR